MVIEQAVLGLLDRMVRAPAPVGARTFSVEWVARS
jgi:hypothetical protein